MHLSSKSKIYRYCGNKRISICQTSSKCTVIAGTNVSVKCLILYDANIRNDQSASVKRLEPKASVKRPEPSLERELNGKGNGGDFLLQVSEGLAFDEMVRLQAFSL